MAKLAFRLRAAFCLEKTYPSIPEMMKKRVKTAMIPINTMAAIISISVKPELLFFKFGKLIYSVNVVNSTRVDLLFLATVTRRKFVGVAPSPELFWAS